MDQDVSFGLWAASSLELYCRSKSRDEEGEIHLARGWTLYLPAMIAAAVTVACAVALSAVSEKAEATFPGKNGRIAYSGYDGNDYEIYTIDSRGGAKRKVTDNNRDDYSPSYSPSGRRIAYVKFDGNDTEIYTKRVGRRSTRSTSAVVVGSNLRAADSLPTRPTAKSSSFGTTTRQQQTPTRTQRSTRSTSVERVRPNSPTTTTTSLLLTIRLTARRSSTQAWQAWSVTMPRATSTRSMPLGVVRENSPTTTSTIRILPTPPTARRSPTRCPKANPGKISSR